MLASLLAAFKLPDLRKRILYVFGMFAIFVAGLHVPVPGINKASMDALFSHGGLLGMLDVFSGGALRRYTIFAMGIMPYINASIIMQLLTVAIPSLEALSKEGEYGRKKISQYTRYMTIVLAFVQALGMNKLFANAGILHVSTFTFVQIALTLVAGTAFLMWIGELITDEGIGNGVSLLIFAGIVASLPPQLAQIGSLVKAGSVSWAGVIGMAILFLGTVLGIVAIEQAQRKIPIQHVKRVVGNKIYQGSSSYLPLRVNSAGVMPIIFAISIELFPMTVAQFANATGRLGDALKFVAGIFSPGTAAGAIIYTILIIFFTYFYTAITFNVPEVADNLKKYGSFIPGIRPGKPTLEYLDRVMSRITLAGAIFLAIIALLQYVSPALTGVNFRLAGGTSLLILVGVALETMRAIEAHLLMRNYEGFIK